MEPVDPNQRALATAAEHLGGLFDEAATAHELDDCRRCGPGFGLRGAAGRQREG